MATILFLHSIDLMRSLENALRILTEQFENLLRMLGELGAPFSKMSVSMLQVFCQHPIELFDYPNQTPS